MEEQKVPNPAHHILLSNTRKHFLRKLGPRCARSDCTICWCAPRDGTQPDTMELCMRVADLGFFTLGCTDSTGRGHVAHPTQATAFSSLRHHLTLVWRVCVEPTPTTSTLAARSVVGQAAMEFCLWADAPRPRAPLSLLLITERRVYSRQPHM